MDNAKADWEKMLRYMLSQYRVQNPDDERDDWELLESLMEHFHKSGLIHKKNGKYLIPTLLDTHIKTVQ
ncbi:MAG TPA: hypothetical protein VN696_01865 [Pyrinomonadaceae bacterium]|nr:hypothetical protein [Pyrinomonadaceae bacterium]